MSVRQKVKYWFKTKALKEQFEAEEARIQKEMRSKLGILIGVGLQGKGTTHDGNTARKYFDNSAITS